MLKNKSWIIILVLALLSANLFGQTLIGQYRCQNTATTTNQIQPHFNIINNSGSSVSLSNVKVRYYYTKEGSASETFWCDYAVIGGGNVHASFMSGYMELSFTGGTMAAGGESGQIQARWAKSDWSNYDQSNDQSFNASMSSFQNWDQIEVYLNGSKVWPSGTGPTPTPTPTTTTPPPTGDAGLVYLSPASSNVQAGSQVTTSVLVNSGSQNVGAYGVDVTYPSNMLSVADITAGTSGIDPVANTNTAGVITVAGFAAQGVGPGTSIGLFNIVWNATGGGTANIGISVEALTDTSYNDIGYPHGQGGIIIIGGPTLPPTTPPPTTPPPTYTPTPTPTGTGSCVGVPVWSASEIYPTAGMKVQYNGVLYENNWYSQNQNPEQNSGPWQVWTNLGPCGSTTPTPTATPPTQTPPDPDAGLVYLSPASSSVGTGGQVTTSVLVDSGSQNIGSFGLDITYPSNLLSVADVVAGSSGIDPVANTNTAGIITVAGFAAQGVGPGSNVGILDVVWNATTAGTANIGISVETLTDTDYNDVGDPRGQGGTIVIGPGPTQTPPDPDAGLVYLSPANSSVAAGSDVDTSVLADSGSQNLASYGMTITYPANLVSVEDVVEGNGGLTGVINTGTAGTITAAGFATSPAGPASGIELIVITWTGVSSGTANIGIDVDTLTDSEYGDVGNPRGQGGTISVSVGPTTPPPTTPPPTQTPTQTPIDPEAGLVYLSPANSSVAAGSDVDTAVLVNSGSQNVASYGITVTYPANVVSVEDVAQGNGGLTAVINSGTAGTITAAGFATSPAGPASGIELIVITWTGVSSGTANIGIDVDTLTDSDYGDVGNPRGQGGTIAVNGIITPPPTTPPPTPTPTPTPTPVVTPVPTPTPPAITAGTVYLDPASSNGSVGSSIATSVLVHTGNQNVAAYGFDVTYPANILSVDSVSAGSSGLTPVVNTGTAGTITAAGFATTGVGPANDVELVVINWTASSSGTASIGISVDSLTDDTYVNIGNPNGVGGTITVF